MQEDQATSAPASNLRIKARNRFVRWFFIAGAAVPLIVMVVGSVALHFSRSTDTGPPDLNATQGFSLVWFVFPTWILFLDAEHPGTIASMLLLAMWVNGVWYAVFGVIVWYFLEGLRKFWPISVRKRRPLQFH